MTTTQVRQPTLKLGKALVTEGLLTQNQLRYALQVQHDALQKRKLGDILLDLGYVTRRQLREVARKYNHRLQLGQVLVEHGVLTNEQLQEAILEQRNTNQRLSAVLLDKKFITEQQLTAALSYQLDYPNILPHRRLIDRSLLRQYPHGLLKQYGILPMSKDKDIVTMLVHDPLDGDALAAVDRLTNGKYELAVATKTQIDRVLDELLAEQSLLSQRPGTPEPEAQAGGFRRYELQKPKGEAAAAGDQVVGVVDFLIANAIEQRASDIHIESMYNCLRVRHRIDGRLVFETDLPRHLEEKIVRRIKVMSGMNPSDTSNDSMDGHMYVNLDGNNIDMRVSVFPSVLGSSLAIRVLPRDVGLKDLSDLGMLPGIHVTVREVLDSPGGLIIFSGPTGAGKTTSLYACLNYLNTGHRKICTIEQPVEFHVEGIAQCQVRSTDSSHIPDLVRGMMRQDPDVLVLGEINDKDTAQTAMQASLSGHQVLTTIHAEDSLGAVMRLMPIGLKTYLLSSTGLIAISQRLVRQICPSCRHSFVPSRRMLSQFHLKDMELESFEFFHGEGCENCGQTGFLGRTGVFEMLAVDSLVRNALLEDVPAANVREMAQKTGRFISLRDSGFLMALNGQTTLDEIMGILSFSEKQSFSQMGLNKQTIDKWMGNAAEEERHAAQMA